MYFVPREDLIRQIRPGVEQCDHGLDLDLDGTIIGITWVIGKRGTLSLEAASTPVSDYLLGDPPDNYLRLPIDRESMWGPLIGSPLTSVRWSDHLECALELSFGQTVVTIAAARWWEEWTPSIEQCSDAIMMLFGEDWHGDVGM